MTSKRTLQIGVAIGWFVFLDVLIRSSNAIVNSAWNLEPTVRGYVRILTRSSDLPNTYPYYLPNQFQWSQIGSGVVAISSILCLVLLFVLVALWLDAISMTKAAIVLITKVEREEIALESFVEQFFGKDVTKSRGGLIGRLLRNLMTAWIMMFILEAVSRIFQGFLF